MRETKRNKKKLHKIKQEYNAKKIVKWAIWYTNLTTLLWSTTYFIKGSVPIELIGLTSIVITGVIVSYFIKARAENVVKIETGNFNTEEYVNLDNFDYTNTNNFNSIRSPNSCESTIIYTGTPQKEEVNI